MTFPGMSLSQVVEQLLSEVKRESDLGSLPDELLSALHAVFGSPLLHALAILDLEDGVVLYKCPAGRMLYQVHCEWRAVCKGYNELMFGAGV